MKFYPRNDLVLIRVNKVETNEAGIVMPENSIQGKEYVVEELGPKVEGLAIGDKVFMLGQEGTDWMFLPNHHDLLMIKQVNVMVVYKDE